MEFTKEQLIRRAQLTVSRGARELENHPDRDGVAADIKIASIAARALMAEPIYQLWDEGYYDTEKEIYDAALKAGGRGRIVYTAPPAPECLTRPVHPRISSEELDDETLDELIDFRRCTFEYHSQQDNKVQTIIHGVTLTAMLELRERRAAMLQGAEPVTTDYKLPEETGSSLQLRNLIRQRHAEWSQATFGDVGPVGPLKHLSKEALEAAEEPEDLSEWADMQFLLWDAQRRAGISDGEITAAMEEKLKVNMARQWPEPKDGEPRLHIKAAPQQEVKP